ncbi:uncharacterized protein LOC132924432 [Rhopalosiphum padi]|uniref:uncharacterized protein LOC132924432 n=1 Tax=Rhopalosiphum padi TaxID=40932 RepID=UPI00298E8837|nr:uncharacterized protein LOC132924432 [Rhopalosiphum padi]
MESNYIDGLSQFNEDLPRLQFVRSPPPSRRVTLVHDVIEVVTTQDHLVEMYSRRDIHRRNHWTANDIELIDLTDDDEDDDFNKRNEFQLKILSYKLNNVHKQMNNCINILLDNNKHVEELEFAIDVIAEFIINIDYANDFVKLGGLYIFLPCFRSEHPSVRIKTCEFLCRLVLNNQYCQNKFMENTNCFKLQVLMYMVENDNDDEVRVKALIAIYSLFRRNLPVFWQFIAHGGKDLIINSLKIPIDELTFKAVFIISFTCDMSNDVVELYIDNGVVEIISSIIMNMENNISSFHHELFLSTLNQFIRLSPVRVKEICSSVEDFGRAVTSLRVSYLNNLHSEVEMGDVLWLIRELNL